ncbi:MAG: FAD-dependent oxidoreductase [Chloroherpetonaceae bacterium]|nr:FAD-dependent oxidoreductase [Chloroherpetonaceae bacterium]
MVISVLGAGIQGTLVALALAQKGHSVTLIDKSPRALFRASLRNEGKIHLGFIYAKDKSYRTSSLMLKSAIRFAPIVDEILERQLPWENMRSLPFVYVISKESMLAPDELIKVYSNLDKDYQEQKGDASVHYLGLKPENLFRLSTSKNHFNWISPQFAQQFVETNEYSLDLVQFQSHLSNSLEISSIHQRFNHTINEVVRTSSGFRSVCNNETGSKTEIRSEIVINCLWEGRLLIDQQLGITPLHQWVYRLKYRYMAKRLSLPPDLSSYTFVLGAYGDIVSYPNSDYYLSWYPIGMKGWSSEISTPQEWETPCYGEINPEVQKNYFHESIKEFQKIVPILHKAEMSYVDAGIIMTWGDTDITDPNSKLHERWEVGINHYDGYFTVDCGKFTCAPYFAKELVTKYL